MWSDAHFLLLTERTTQKSLSKSFVHFELPFLQLSFNVSFFCSNKVRWTMKVGKSCRKPKKPLWKQSIQKNKASSLPSKILSFSNFVSLETQTFSALKSLITKHVKLQNSAVAKYHHGPAIEIESRKERTRSRPISYSDKVGAKKNSFSIASTFTVCKRTLESRFDGSATTT